MARAGYDMRIATVDSRCGGCGADISQGAEYGYDPIAMQICEGCIQVFEEEDRAKKRTFSISFRMRLLAFALRGSPRSRLAPPSQSTTRTISAPVAIPPGNSMIRILRKRT